MQNTVQVDRSPAAFVELQDASDLDKNLKEAGTDEPVLIQFTAPWCNRCGVLKQEIASRFDAPLRWLVVDVDRLNELQERFNVSVMPRIDVYCGGRSDSVEGFDAKIEEIVTMVTEATKKRHVFELDLDF